MVDYFDEKSRKVLMFLVPLAMLFLVLLITEDTGNLITGSAAENLDFEANEITTREKVIYVLGIIVFFLLAIYLFILYRKEKHL